MDKKIHLLQKKILQIYRENNFVLPPFRQIAKKIGVSSTNTVNYHIQKLKNHGYLKLGASPKGVVSLTLGTLFDFESKSGVYVLLKKNLPFFVGESENLKKHIFKQIINNNNLIATEIKSNLENINIAYYLISKTEERLNLKNYLIKYYQEKGFKLL